MFLSPSSSSPYFLTHFYLFLPLPLPILIPIPIPCACPVSVSASASASFSLFFCSLSYFSSSFLSSGLHFIHHVQNGGRTPILEAYLQQKRTG
jgi:hypothetical protein